MTSYLLPIINSWAMPDTDVSSSDVYWEPITANFATAAIPSHGAFAFANLTQRQGIAGKFTVPLSYATAPQIEVRAAATATGNIVVWDFEYRARGATEAMGASAWDSTTPTINMSLVGTVARDLQTATMALTAADLVAGNEVQFRLMRDGVNTSDTYAGTIWLFDAYFRFADT